MQLNELGYFLNRPPGYSRGPWRLPGARRHRVGDPCCGGSKRLTVRVGTNLGEVTWPFVI